MFDKNYICAPKGIPFVAFYKKLEKPDGTLFTRLHYHNDFEIIYICEGTAEFIIDGKEYIAGPDTVVLINPYETHSSQIIKGPILYYCLDFDISMLDIPSASSVVQQKQKYRNIIQNLSIKEFVKASFEAYFNTPSGWQTAVKGNLMLVFSKVEDALVDDFTQKDNFVKKLLEYIDNNIGSPITSKAAADAFGYDQSYFCRNFKKHFRCKFGDYVNICRVEKAKNMMYNNNKITQIALICGFSSSSMFSRIFKKYTGFSPSEYQKRLKEKIK